MTSARESLVYPGRVSLSVRSSVMLMLARVYFSAAIKTEKRREIDTHQEECEQLFDWTRWKFH